MWLYVHRPNKRLSINSTLGEAIQDYVASLYIAKYFKQARELAGREDGNLASTVQAIWSQEYLSWSHNWRPKKYLYANGILNYKSIPKKAVSGNFENCRFFDVAVFITITCNKKIFNHQKKNWDFAEILWCLFQIPYLFSKRV